MNIEWIYSDCGVLNNSEERMANIKITRKHLLSYLLELLAFSFWFIFIVTILKATRALEVTLHYDRFR